MWKMYTFWWWYEFMLHIIWWFYEVHHCVFQRLNFNFEYGWKQINSRGAHINYQVSPLDTLDAGIWYDGVRKGCVKDWKRGNIFSLAPLLFSILGGLWCVAAAFQGGQQCETHDEGKTLHTQGNGRGRFWPHPCQSLCQRSLGHHWEIRHGYGGYFCHHPVSSADILL